MKPTNAPIFVPRRPSVLLSLLLLTVVGLRIDPALGFRSSIVKLASWQRTSFLAHCSSPVLVKQKKRKQQQSRRSSSASSSQLNMFMGSDGGLFGVGTPEVVTILLVGYFVLGPSELYKLVKEIGKFIQNIRTLGNDFTTSLESNMESQLQLQEIRKAQQELNEAFSFRRSINVNPTEAFSTTVTSPRSGASTAEAVLGGGAAAAAVASQDFAAPKKKIRRRVKKAELGIVPDELQMPTPLPAESTVSPAAQAALANNRNKLTSDPFVQDTYTPEELAQIDADFDKYTLFDNPADYDTPSSWLDTPRSTMSSATRQQQQPSNTTVAAGVDDDAASRLRFQQQLSGNWNAQILEQGEASQLSPYLTKVMQLIASLEEEKIAANQRLDEEYRRRAEIQEDMFREQKQLLEQAIREIQKEMASSSASTTGTKTTTQSTTAS